MDYALPLVSIAMPSYNYASYIERAIRSAMAQTYPNIEIVISDNASSDSSVEIVSRLAAGDARIRYSVNETNVGPFENLRIVREASKGEYIVFLSADDILFPHHVSAAIEYYRTHPECDLRHTAFAVIGEDGELTDVLKHPGHVGIRSISPREELAYALVSDGHYMWPSIVFPRRVLDSIGPLATHVTAADMDYLFRANRAGLRIAFDGTPSVGYRRHPGAVSSRENFIQSGKHYHDWLTLYEENLSDDVLPRLVGKRSRITAIIDTRITPLTRFFPERASEIAANEAELYHRARARALAIPAKLDAASAAFPRFSIILPTMSALAQLKRSVDSVLQQREKSWELIVVSNDGRNIESLLRSWVDPAHLVYIETLGVANAANARNIAMRVSRGETIAYLDEGDTWHPTYLATVSKVLDASNADVVRVGADCAFYDAREFGPGPVVQNDSALFAPPAKPYVDGLGIYAPLSALAHRGYCAEITGGFSEGLTLLEDWDFIARLVGQPQFQKVDVTDMLVTSAYYRGLAQQTLGQRLAALPDAYQAVSSSLKADPQASNSRLSEIVNAANALMGAPENVDRLHAFVQSIYGYRQPTGPA
jgi:glycosyltransferase involved in cell wall biosynthesis